MGKKIIVIDDEVKLTANIKIFLELHGYSVTVANSGQEGIQKAKADKPDLMIIDIIMPGMDGTSTAEALKENASTSTVPIIFLSGLLSGQGEEQTGTGDYRLAKPFDMNKLLELIKRIIG
ncbi:MAG: response regulator [Candidatus Omnitrophica bacterium]|nr:response regulator [Candidatus Omnitrophota bacterium]